MMFSVAAAAAAAAAADISFLHPRGDALACKRYWWWATNIFAVRGAKTRHALPVCIVSEIRRLHPAPDGVYKGFSLAENWL